MAYSACRCSRLSPYLLSILRIVVALLFIPHGSQKLFAFPASSGKASVELFSASSAESVGRR